MGSFFHATATRLSKDESIIFPSSHCHYCSHKLKWYELIPIVSYVIQLGRCRKCKIKLPLSYLIIEVATALLYLVAYHVFKLTPELLIALIFISTLIIIIISDIEYMIILDEVLLIGITLIIICYFCFYGFLGCAYHVVDGVLAFLTMYVIKIIGDIVFRKESLGGGDIKLMFLFGLVLGYAMSIVTIFLATFIAFPIAIFILLRHKDHVIPYGPFLSVAAIIILISKLNLDTILEKIVSS